MNIEIVGPGCYRCIKTEENIRNALSELNIDANVSHVSDLNEIAKRGVMFTPAVIVDGEIKIYGKIPTIEELKEILQNHKGGG